MKLLQRIDHRQPRANRGLVKHSAAVLTRLLHDLPRASHGTGSGGSGMELEETVNP